MSMKKQNILKENFDRKSAGGTFVLPFFVFVKNIFSLLFVEKYHSL